MIKLISGLPGAGKSLRSVELVKQGIDSGRPVYVCGINGLVDLGQLDLADPSDWRDLPDGSLVVVDEAQKWWGQRRAGDPPDAIRALSEHRHRGFDFILVTQHPTMLDAYVRKLVGEHQHVLRQFGAQMSRIVTWTECQDDPQSLATRQRGTDAIWTYPKSLYSLYKSATMHTVKKRIPLRLVLIPALLIAVVGLGWWGYKSVTSIGDYDTPKPAASAVQAAMVANGTIPGPTAPITQAEYLARVTPRVSHQPWSMPALDGREVTADPQIYCISTPAKGSCTCLTEQGTRYAIDIRQCMTIARWGNYNAFKVSSSDRSKDQPRAEAQAASTLSGPVPATRLQGSTEMTMSGSSGSRGPSFNYTPPASR